MTHWLDPVRAALGSGAEARIFFRNDDVGWAPARCASLLDLFEASASPLDLAIIPRALEPTEACSLLARRARGARIGFHQHGFAHVNHEPSGRKCEFGAARAEAEVQAEIAHGRRLLEDALGPIDPIFTPPWNRCGPATARALVALNFRALSRDASASGLDSPELGELSIRIDFSHPAKGQRANPRAFGELVARELGVGGRVGVMLHHALMDAADREALGELLDLFVAHRTPLVGMRQLLQGPLVREDAR